MRYSCVTVRDSLSTAAFMRVTRPLTVAPMAGPPEEPSLSITRRVIRVTLLRTQAPSSLSSSTLGNNMNLAARSLLSRCESDAGDRPRRSKVYVRRRPSVCSPAWLGAGKLILSFGAVPVGCMGGSF
uniref:Uncharacterized protein n=1 Tax=Plectus sambesii TaxID=2011161 RepID=A0A914X729_9BILA